jgi:Ca-activated chloride channel family protein
MIEFLWPWMACFLPLPMIVHYLVPRAERTEAALQVPFFGTAATYSGGTASGTRRRWLRRTLLVLIWSALVVAGTRPQFIGEPIELPASGRDLLLAVDISGSMGTEDMVISNQMTTRLIVVKQVVGDFVARRHGDRLGLILFGTQAYLQTPLTFDRNTVQALLEETPLGIAGGKTAIGDAIGLAVKRLLARPAENRVLILLTDGVNNVGEVEPLQAARLAAQEGIRIYTIGFGADEMVVQGLLFNRRINPSAELDTKTLTEIARLTGGIYQRARSADELKAIYSELDKLEPIEQDQEVYRPIKSLFFWPLGFALLASLAYAALHPILITWLLAGLASQRARGSQQTAS